MTRDEARRAAEVMLAYADGKTIERRSNTLHHWTPVKHPDFDWSGFYYRVKPEPREFDLDLYTLKAYTPDDLSARRGWSSRWIRVREVLED